MNIFTKNRERKIQQMEMDHIIISNKEGSVVLVVMLILVLLTFLGIASINTSTMELKIYRNQRLYTEAFYDAEAGVQYTLACLENDLKKGTANVLPTKEDDPVSYSYGTPGDFSFSISDIQFSDKDPDPDQYWFTSTGNAPNAPSSNAQVKIKATFTGETITPFTFAAFGDKKMEVKNSGSTESYDSDSADPKISDPDDPDFEKTGKADIGSNKNLITKTGALIDGNGVVGKDSAETQGEYDIKSGSVFTGTAPNLQDRVDPDPLGVTSGGEYDPTEYSVDNDNTSFGTINGTPLGTSITTNNGDTVTLEGKSGGSNFYFTSIELKNNVDLVIDTTSGPVNIFLDDASGSGGTIFDAKNSSIVNTSGKTTDFAVYSNSTDEITLHHDSEFTGIIYAPYAEIDMKNSSDIYGAIWGSEITIRNSGDLFFDEALTDKYEVTNTNELSLVSWEEQ